MIRRVTALLLALVCAGAGPAHAIDHDTLVRAAMNEAEGESYQSKLAHAFLFLNRARAGMTVGSSGLDSAKVRARLARASVASWTDAKMAVQVAINCGVPDPTRGAVYCENVKAFGVPAFIKKMLRAGEIEEVLEINGVKFWRVKK